MNKTFKNDLQTHIQNIGVKDKKFILTSSQHPLDRWLHECFVADNLYRIGDQRRSIARGIFRTELADAILAVNDTAVAHGLTQNEELINTGNYTLSLQAKKPSMRLNTTRLRTELIKAGCTPQMVDAAWEASTEEQDPVDVFTVNTTGNGI